MCHPVTVPQAAPYRIGLRAHSGIVPISPWAYVGRRLLVKLALREYRKREHRKNVSTEKWKGRCPPGRTSFVMDTTR